jgi:hypothetical protein
MKTNCILSLSATATALANQPASAATGGRINGHQNSGLPDAAAAPGKSDTQRPQLQNSQVIQHLANRACKEALEIASLPLGARLGRDAFPDHRPLSDTSGALGVAAVLKDAISVVCSQAFPPPDA